MVIFADSAFALEIGWSQNHSPFSYENIDKDHIKGLFKEQNFVFLVTWLLFLVSYADKGLINPNGAGGKMCLHFFQKAISP